MSEPKFVPNTVYVTYIASTPEKVWEALTGAEFTRQYFFGHSIEVEAEVGGRFILRAPDGSVHMSGRVIEYDPPRRLATTWRVEGMEAFRELPKSLVTYEIEPMGGSVKLTMTEAHQWDIPDAILAGGRQGWPFILSSLKSILETGKPIEVGVKMGPPPEMMAAIKEAVTRNPICKALVLQKPRAGRRLFHLLAQLLPSPLGQGVGEPADAIAGQTLLAGPPEQFAAPLVAGLQAVAELALSGFPAVPSLPCRWPPCKRAFRSARQAARPGCRKGRSAIRRGRFPKWSCD